MFFFFVFGLAGKGGAQCDDAVLCVGNINDFKCITFGTSQQLIADGKLLPFDQANWLKERVELNLDTRNLPAGIYQIEVRTEDGQRSLSRLSIVH
ncbi:MAG: hypothetical protein NZM43_01980 [Saprospiraceae bacterium]|nr:hypothetical protein [Saprospiraceae bacterium]MDW8483068.1 hypothetical protein [Saprospiraceae bacterium]